MKTCGVRHCEYVAAEGAIGVSRHIVMEGAVDVKVWEGAMAISSAFWITCWLLSSRSSLWSRSLDLPGLEVTKTLRGGGQTRKPVTQVQRMTTTGKDGA